MNKSKIEHMLRGVFAPVVTPFAPTQAVDTDAIRENMDRYNATPLRGYVVLGSDGEHKSLAEDERLRVLTCVSERKGDKAVIAGVMAESLTLAQLAIAYAAESGADFVLIQTPCYFRNQMSHEALYGFFTDLADTSPIPLILCNAPAFTGIEMSLFLLTRLGMHPNIVGVEDSVTDIQEHLGADLGMQVMAGSISQLFSAVTKGAPGGTVALANYLPALACRLWTLASEGNKAEGEVLHARLVALSKTIAGQFGVPGNKAAMALMGFHGGVPRKPLPALQPHQTTQIKVALEEAGVLPA